MDPEAFDLEPFKSSLRAIYIFNADKESKKCLISSLSLQHKLINIFGREISKSFKLIEKKGSGAIVLINSNMAPEIDKIFKRRDSKEKKLELREYGVGAQILLELGLHKIILLSNSNKKIIALDGFDLEIISQEKI